MFRRNEALGFRSGLGLAQMRARLNALGPFEFVTADSDAKGEYLTSRVATDSFVKIHERQPGEFDVNLKYRSKLEEGFSVLQMMVLKTVLPAVGATDVVPAEPEDR